MNKRIKKKRIKILSKYFNSDLGVGAPPKKIKQLIKLLESHGFYTMRTYNNLVPTHRYSVCCNYDQYIVVREPDAEGINVPRAVRLKKERKGFYRFREDFPPLETVIFY